MGRKPLQPAGTETILTNNKNPACPGRQVGAGALLQAFIERGFTGIELVHNMVTGQQNRRGQSHPLFPDSQGLQALSQTFVRLWRRIEERDKSRIGIERRARAECPDEGRIWAAAFARRNLFWHARRW